MSGQTPGQAAYEARQARRLGVERMQPWASLSLAQREHEEAGAQAAVRATPLYAELAKQLAEATAERDDYAARLKAADRSRAQVAAERDSLRDIIARLAAAFGEPDQWGIRRAAVTTSTISRWLADAGLLPAEAKR